MDEASKSPIFKKRKISRQPTPEPSPPASDLDLFSSPVSPSSTPDRMWDKYIDENKGDYNIETNIHHSQDSVNDNSVQTSIMDENKSLKLQVKELGAENEQLKLEVKQLRENANEVLKKENDSLKEQIEEYEFSILMQKSTQTA